MQGALARSNELAHEAADVMDSDVYEGLGEVRGIPHTGRGAARVVSVGCVATCVLLVCAIHMCLFRAPGVERDPRRP